MVLSCVDVKQFDTLVWDKSQNLGDKSQQPSLKSEFRVLYIVPGVVIGNRVTFTNHYVRGTFHLMYKSDTMSPQARRD
jgi:hypothetical protein